MLLKKYQKVQRTKEFNMYLFKNSLKCFSNFINCLLWDLITILIEESIAAEGSMNTMKCKNKLAWETNFNF